MRRVGATKAVGIADLDGYSRWTVHEKREHLNFLSERVWDIEDELARARTARARLMNSLQTDLNRAG
jgi:hypothetical protein